MEISKYETNKISGDFEFKTSISKNRILENLMVNIV